MKYDLMFGPFFKSGNKIVFQSGVIHDEIQRVNLGDDRVDQSSE